jgi:hypothetical protein
VGWICVKRVSAQFRSAVTGLLKTLTPTVERIWDDFSPISLAKIYHYQLQVLKKGREKQRNL